MLKEKKQQKKREYIIELKMKKEYFENWKKEIKTWTAKKKKQKSRYNKLSRLFILCTTPSDTIRL